MKAKTGILWASTALSLAALCAISFPAIAVPESAGTRQNRIAQTIGTLKRSPRRWIEVDLSDQRLIGWEGSTQVFSYLVSTGKAATPTPTGVFSVQIKRISDRMRGEDYNVPNVPYAMYFSGGYAIHGAYWHNQFGTPVSHGCVNVRVDRAERLFDWASVGTPVVIHR